jgi:hypothetical protein
MDNLLKQCRDALAIIKGETSPDGRLTMLPQQEAFIRQTIAACDADLARTDWPSDCVLLPCPFCGCSAYAIGKTCAKNDPYREGDRAYPIVRCAECAAQVSGEDWSEPGTAIVKWNNRQGVRAPRVSVPERRYLKDRSISDDTYSEHSEGWDDCRAECIDAIRAAGGVPVDQHGKELI